MRVAVAAIALAACGPLPSDQPPKLPWGRPPTAIRSPATQFLAEPGLVQVDTTTTTPDEWGSSTYMHTQVLRGGRVVCELTGASFGAQENHRWRTDVSIVRRSHDPLRFDVKRTSWSNDFGTNDETCTRYQLPATGTCRVERERTCVPTCAPTIAIASRAGTGRIVGTATGDGEPLAGVTIISTGDGAADSNGNAITDDNGAFAITPNNTVHAVDVYVRQQIAHAAVDEHPDQDTVVTITATGCTCCATP